MSFLIYSRLQQLHKTAHLLWEVGRFPSFHLLWQAVRCLSFWKQARTFFFCFIAFILIFSYACEQFQVPDGQYCKWALKTSTRRFHAICQFGGHSIDETHTTSRKSTNIKYRSDWNPKFMMRAKCMSKVSFSTRQKREQKTSYPLLRHLLIALGLLKFFAFLPLFCISRKLLIRAFEKQTHEIRYQNYVHETTLESRFRKHTCFHQQEESDRAWRFVFLKSRFGKQQRFFCRPGEHQ